MESKWKNRVEALIVSGLLLCAVKPIIVTAGELDYPTKPVIINVGVSPGGAAAVSALIFAENVRKYLPRPQNFIVTYKPGAAGMIALAYVMREPADGYNLVWFEAAATTKMAVEASLQPFTLKDFSYIGVLATTPNAIGVKEDSPFKTLEDFIDYAKKHPMELTFGSSGLNGFSHLSGEMFMAATGTKLLHVPFKGGAEVMTAVLGGHVTTYIGSLGSMVPYLHPRRGLRILAVDYPRRLTEFGLGAIPTFLERGFDVGENHSFQGLIARKDTPKPVLDSLRTALHKTGEDPDVKAALAKAGLIVLNWGPEEMEKRVEIQYQRARDVFRK